MKRKIIAISFLVYSLSVFSQDDSSKQSNIQSLTPSKLIKKGDWDIKVFNNLYTQTKSEDNGAIITGPRANFFTTTFETYTGVSANSRINLGLIINLKSNTFDKSATSVFSYENDKINSRSGITSVAPSIKYQPFKQFSNFSIQSTFHIPIFEDVPGFYLDKRSYIFENRFYFDRSFGAGKFQFFGELDLTYHFGEKSKGASLDENSGERFANNTLGVPVSIFLSYFPSTNFTVYINTQHYELFDLGSDFAQSYTLVGLGTKFQLTQRLNVEISYANFIQARGGGLGSSYNLGIRYLIIR